MRCELAALLFSLLVVAGCGDDMNRRPGERNNRGRVPSFIPQPNINLALEGDSLQSGSLTVMEWSEQANWSPFRVQRRNYATGGYRMCTQLYNRRDAFYASTYDPTKLLNIAVLWGGTNDLTATADQFSDYTAQSIYDAKRAWGLGAKAAGFDYVIAMSILRRQLTEPFATKRTDTNALLFANGVADGAFDEIVDSDQVPGSELEFVYWQNDHLHLNTAGQANMLAVMDPVIRAVMAANVTP